MSSLIQKYRKKPVEITAIQFDGSTNSKEAIIDFCEGKAFFDAQNKVPSLIIKTLEGDMKVYDNDFVIKGVEGEFYPCKPSVFEKTYDLVKNK